jgi:hypothetical protein
MTNKTIDTLLEDIDNLFKNGHKFNEENLNKFLTNIKEILIDRFTKKEDDKPYLRMSMLGTPNRKLWYIFNKPIKRERVADLKFIYGDLIEQLMLLLSKEAGHKVVDEQAEIEVDGIKGHIDAVIDDYVTDLKSASSFAFKKFFNGTLFQDDSFGYIAQISGYMHALKNRLGCFFAINKENGQQTILKVDEIDTINIPTRVKEAKEIITLSSPPKQKCYPDEEFGKSGNRVLNKNCTYCPYQDQCWSEANGGMGLRRFKYSNDVVAFTEVLKTPNVDEIPQ